MHHPFAGFHFGYRAARSHLASAIGLNSGVVEYVAGCGRACRDSVIVLLGLANTFGLAVIAYVPLILTLMFLPVQSRSTESAKTGRFLQKLRDGGRVALRTPLIFTALCMVGLNSFFVRGVLEIQPAIVGQVLGGDSQLLAMATAAAGIGALLASAWIGWGRLQPDFVQRCLWPMLAIGLLGTAALDFATGIWAMSTLFVLTGFTATVTGIGAQTLIQLTVDEAYRARVMTWWYKHLFRQSHFGEA